MSYWKALGWTAKSVPLGLTDWQMWEYIRDGARALLALVVRILINLLYPVSVPLIAVVVMLHERKRAAQVLAARERRNKRS